MRWLLFNRGPKALSLPLRQALVAQFNLDPQSLRDLRYIDKPGKFIGKPVRNVRIFDPKLANGTPTTELTYDTLATSTKALLFSGRIEDGGFVYLVDRRPPKRAIRPSGPVPSTG